MNKIVELLKSIESIQSSDALNAVKRVKRDFAKQYNIADIPSNVDLLKQYRQLVSTGVYVQNKHLESLLKKR